jgi:alpha-N-arabinofuranosidase
MDGPWQIGQMSAPEYGVKAREAAKIMRWVDPSVKLIACGSSTTRIPSYPEWDKTVLEHLYDYVDYLSLHRYYENEGDLSDYLASFHDMDQFIKTVSGVVGYVKAKTRSRKQVYLSFDEWNIWYQRNQKTPESWEIAPPLLEDNYSLLDSLVFGGLLCTLLNNADTVRMACLAQLVNVIAPIMTKPGGGLFRQTIFYPFAQVSEFGKGKVLKTLTHSPVKVTKTYGEVPAVQSVLIHDEESGALTLFALNTLEDEPAEFSLDLRSFGNVSFLEHVVMDGPDISVKNTFDNPDQVIPRIERTAASVRGDGEVSVVLPKLSWNMVRLSSDAR